MKLNGFNPYSKGGEACLLITQEQENRLKSKTASLQACMSCFAKTLLIVVINNQIHLLLFIDVLDQSNREGSLVSVIYSNNRQLSYCISVKPLPFSHDLKKVPQLDIDSESDICTCM